jgi:hypothetical protein
MTEEDKGSLARKRVELIESLNSPLSTADRVRLQGELSITNAQIKALNTTEAARLKAAADRRKAAGLVEAQANAARARANTGLYDATPRDEDNDSARTAAIDDWIGIVLGDSGIKVKRTRTGLDFCDVPEKWLVVLQRLRAGIHAAARGQELPDVEPEPEPAPPPAPRSKKR